MADLNEILGSVVKEGVEIGDVSSQLNSYIEQEMETRVSKLASTKDQILSEKRALREEFDSYRSKYGWADELENFSQETWADTQSQMESLRISQSQTTEELQQKLEEKYNAGKSAIQATLEPKLNALKLESEKFAKERDTYRSKYEDYLVQNRLQKALDATGVKADEYWKEGFKNQAKVSFTDTGDLAEISVKHNNSYIPLEDWEKVFPTTERGKSMIPAGFNTGAGARGGVSGTGAKSQQEIAKIQDPKARQAALREFYEKNKK